MATAPRKTQTPGVKTAPVEEVQTTDQQADDALDAILGLPKDEQSTNETSSPSEPVEEDGAKKEYEEFLAWRQNKTEPVAPHEATSNATTPIIKRTRQVVGPNGWTTEEY
ncbi:hypothetical protein B9T31_15990 [Acinetobacter sp. ANC 4558]|uniref:hypothetical protein n=1 Tax=Acinetobacter sp. ANC 4558 TaxID=1977876 RepID=UPI000A34C08A|nr:hypothetical protein [Acinetobacter sp. ANC 4558]OTG80799.1 hypothetical protein B9T31_15990 [Acinetobacter sp. ANC 4558]